MATAASPLTLEQFFGLPDPENGSYEWHGGEVVLMPFPSQLHTLLQDQLLDLLRTRLRDFGTVSKEFPYTPAAGECRRADVAAVSLSRFRAIRLDWILEGSPELVIEVTSPSNTVSRLMALEQLCLRNGAKQFWVVYSDLRLVEVRFPNGNRTIYEGGSRIPLGEFGSAESLPVDEIFRVLMSER